MKKLNKLMNKHIENICIILIIYLILDIILVIAYFNIEFSAVHGINLIYFEMDYMKIYKEYAKLKKEYKEMRIYYDDVMTMDSAINMCKNLGIPLHKYLMINKNKEWISRNIALDKGSIKI